MFQFRKCMALFMFVVFAALLYSELGNFDADFMIGHEAGSSVSVSNLQKISPLGSASDHCSDPCHSGVCHFGHCAHFAMPQQNLSFALFVDQNWVQSDSNILPSPYLDNWKRPPRQDLFA